MKRGEVWWADLPRPLGRRPAVLISRDSAYEVRSYVTVAPVFSRIRHNGAEVVLGPEDGLPRVSAANCDSMLTASKAILRERIAMLNADQLRAVDAAIHFALGLDA
ncbi:MAG: type II toxin-antitoxin system PemK/MazF family toxin [Chloroflexi bacterium]|nr:type II toxin-antitoxin system PemK/MazF family toxin [Chloroflexota bacterium]